MNKIIIETLKKRMKKTDNELTFIPPDNGDVCWIDGAETFTRLEVCLMIWSQIAMISNDLKQGCGNDLTKDMFSILENPRVIEF